MQRNHSRTFVVLLAALGPIALAAADRRLSYDELAAASDKVVLGTVGVKSSRWGDDSRIYTEVVISPDVAVKGAEEGAVTVEVLGGVIGDTRMTVSDGPELPEGERVVVFLKRHAGHFVVVGRSAGAVAASTEEGSKALDGAFRHVERVSGRRMTNRRSLAESYLKREAVKDRAATATQAAQVGCYSTDGAKWGTTSAAYRIGASIPAGWAASIDASAATWSNAGVAFRLVNDSTSPNELSYADLVAKYGSSYANTYAVTTTWSSTSSGRISKATIEVNTKWPWSTAVEANKADVQNILTHEFGHWMRLLDIYSPLTCGEVTMWGSAAFGETKKRSLDAADIAGFQSLYGAGTGGTTVAAPVLTAPANGATGVSATPVLVWGASASATSYDVYLGQTASPGAVATVSATSFQPGTLTAGSTYFWRVVAKNASGSASSAVYSFTVAGPSGTTAGPTLLSPANGATGVSVTPVMQWTAVSGATAYDLYIGTTTSPGRIGSVSGTAVTVRGFQSGTLYYWRVVARTASGATYSSALGSFRTN